LERGRSATHLERGALIAFALLAWAALAAPVAAHENEVIRFGSFLGGVTHPVLGPDHLLAMLSVGILSTQIGGRAILTVPATFVTFMAVGGAFGILVGGIPMGLIEFGIAASVLVLGAVIAVGRRMPVLVAMSAVAIFGSMHGYAHGVETPTIAEPALYAMGFLIGTAAIHLIGVLIGEVALQYRNGTSVLRLGGAMIALMGSLFLVGVI
jgi:urease accessory protein